MNIMEPLLANEMEFIVQIHSIVAEADNIKLTDMNSS